MAFTQTIRGREEAPLPGVSRRSPSVTWDDRNSTEPSLGNVNVVFGDPDKSLRQAVRGDLRERGLVSTMDTDKVPAILERLKENAVDILVCDVDLPDGDTCGLIHRVRQQKLGGNPFVLTVTLSANPSIEKVRRMVDSGSDDIIVKPVSMNILATRLFNLIERRKPFVVTTDYTGPNRRKGHRAGTEAIPLIEVPNPAQLRMDRRFSESALQRIIDQASRKLNAHKLERHAIQVSYLVRMVLGICKTNRGPAEMHAPLKKLVFVSGDIQRRLIRVEDLHVAELCRSLSKVSVSLMQHPCGKSPQDLKLLTELSSAIETALRLPGHGSEAAYDISDQVTQRYPT